MAKRSRRVRGAVGSGGRQSGKKITATYASLRAIPKWSVVEVAWADIVEDPTGDPTRAQLIVRNTLGRVFGVSKSEGLRTLVLTYTKDPDGSSQSGWICIPLHVIKDVVVIRKEVGKNEV